MQHIRNRNKWMAIFAGLGMLAFTMPAVSSLSEEMKIMSEAYGKAQEKNTPEVFRSELNRLRTAAVNSKDYLPKKLEKEAPESAQISDYHAGMKKLIDAIDKALALEVEGKIAEARALVKNDLAAIRNENHRKFR